VTKRVCEKIAQNEAQLIFCPNECVTCTAEKSSYFCYFQKAAQGIGITTKIGENSPN
jgi:hypothetical protein